MSQVEDDAAKDKALRDARVLNVKLTVVFDDDLTDDDRNDIKDDLMVSIDNGLRRGYITTGDHDPKDWSSGMEWTSKIAGQ